MRGRGRGIIEFMAMLMTKEQKAAQRATKKQENAERKARIEKAHQETREIVAKGKCPRCGNGLRRNNSILGWWQCEQYGAVQWRKDPQKEDCGWQGFTE
jgi:hypothetical protein